jgi:hypothetical protein
VFRDAGASWENVKPPIVNDDEDAPPGTGPTAVAPVALSKVARSEKRMVVALPVPAETNSRARSMTRVPILMSRVPPRVGRNARSVPEILPP